MWWIGVFLLLQAYDPTSAQVVNVEFLKGVPRFNSTATPTYTNPATDYYFCCNVVGRLLQWEYNHTPLSGFRIDDRGKVFVDERSDYTYTATLLSSQPVEDNQAKMDSVLVMSFPSGTDPGQFTISCSSNFNISSTIAGTVSTVEDHGENGGVLLDYVASGNVVSNRDRTHILMCGVQNIPQFIDVTGPTLTFSRFDDVGQAKTIFSDDRNTVEVQGVLVVRGTHQAITLILVATSSDVFSVSCYDNMNRLSLSIEESVEGAISESVFETTTYAILETTVTPSEVLVENVTEPTTLVLGSEFGTLHVHWIVPVIMVPPGIAIIVFITIIIAAWSWLKRNTYILKIIMQPNDTVEVELSNSYRNDGGISNACGTELADGNHGIYKLSSNHKVATRKLSDSNEESGDSGVVKGDSSSNGSCDIGVSDGDTLSTDTDESCKSCEENETSADSSLQSEQEVLPEKQGDNTNKQEEVGLDIEEAHESQSKNPSCEPFIYSQDENGLLSNSGVAVSKTSLPQTSIEIDDVRKKYISSELDQIQKHVLNLMKINREVLQQANVVVSVKVTIPLKSQLCTPIFDSSNAIAVCFDGQQEMEENNNAVLMAEEMIEDNECSNKVEDISDETNNANNEKDSLRVEDDANQELNHSNGDKRGNIDEAGNGEERNNGDEWDNVRDNRDENVDEQEFHHSASSASLTETDTTPVDSTKVEYCYILGDGLDKADKIPIIGVSELSVENPETSGTLHCSDLEKKMSMFSGIVDSAGRDMNNTMMTVEPMPPLLHYSNDATPDMVLRQRLIKTVD